MSSTWNPCLRGSISHVQVRFCQACEVRLQDDRLRWAVRAVLADDNNLTGLSSSRDTDQGVSVPDVTDLG